MWAEMTAENGKRFLLNTEACFGIMEGEAGGAILVSTHGAQVPLSATFAQVSADIAGEPAETTPGG